jgi:tetraacyldisaccharide 4'-kinase
MREPAFWWRKPAAAARALAPLARVYGAFTAARLARVGEIADVPVVCIGNPTLGGAGKTPMALAVARLLAAAGEQPVFLSRGYGGALPGPVRVDPTRHDARQVGDEPLLLARIAPTIVARDRRAGAHLAAGASVIVMDDGFQNPALAKDVSVLMVDARRGIGNGCVFPAGPLRAPLSVQLARADALVMVGPAPPDPEILAQARAHSIAVFTGSLAPDAAALRALAGVRVLAFAGIGDPGKLFATLEAAGIEVVARRSFPDHHRYSPREARDLCAIADREGLALVTTEKDLARLAGDAAAGMLAARARALPVSLVLAEADAFGSLLIQRLAATRRARQSPLPSTS